MKKLIAVLISFLFVFSPLYVYSAASGSIVLRGADEIEGNLFYISVSLSTGSNVCGGQGTILYTGAQVEILDTVSYLPQGYDFEYYDDLNGKITYLFYRTEKNVPALSGEYDLFVIYFQINREPEGSRINLSLTNGIISDTKNDTSTPASNYSAPIKDYTPPVTTAPPPPITTAPPAHTTVVQTKPPIETTTAAPTSPITSQSPETSSAVTTEVITEAPISTYDETSTNSTSVPQTTAAQAQTSSGIRLFEVILISASAALIAGTAVYFVMKKKFKR